MPIANLVTWFKTDRRTPTRRRVQLTLESLEARDVPAMNPTGLEQEMLELTNRMRMDPAGELNRLLISTSPLKARDSQVQSALTYFGVSGSTLASQWASLRAVQPLAWAEGLMNAARSHNQAMIAADSQSHQLPGEAGLGSRATNGGYRNWNSLGENVYAYANSVLYGHAGFAIDWGYGTGGIQSPAGHRNNIMSASFREVGISVLAENNPSTEVGPLVITQDFGNRSGFGNSYLLGVVYNDANKNNTYNAGEGVGGVTVKITGSTTFTTTTMTAGGYQLQVPAGTYTVTFSGGGLSSSITKSVTVGSANVKLDALAGQSSSPPPTGNSAPVLNASYVATLTSISQGTINPAGNTVASIVGNSITDSNAGQTLGIAVYGMVNTNGKWQYSVNGSTWTDFGNPTTSSARLLRPTDRIRFVPNASYSGTASISYRAWDQTSGTVAGIANISTTSSVGGSTAFSVAVDSASVTVTSGNNAPVLLTNGRFVLPTIPTSTTVPGGVQVSSILGTNVTDADAGALKGFAITAADNTRGTWQYTINGGRNWYNLTTVSNTSALLLRSSDYVRFYPKAGQNGVSSFVFRAWDQTSGSVGTFVNSSLNGGRTAFSTDQVFAQVQVGNTAPVLNTSSSFTLNSYRRGSANPGTLVSLMLGQRINDSDLNAKQGIAVTGLTGTTTGTWQFSTNGGSTWINFGNTGLASARLLRSQDLIRYVPNAGFTGQVTFQFRAWDQTSGIYGNIVNLSSNNGGGTTAYSSALATAKMSVI